MADVFVSYTGADKGAAAAVAFGLTRAGLTVFWDAEIAPGDTWDSRIERELQEASAVVVLWSRASRERFWVRNEARFGNERGVLLPARIDDCEPPLEFTHLQTCDLRGLGDDVGAHANWSALVSSILGIKEREPIKQPTIQGGGSQATYERRDEELAQAAHIHTRYDVNLLHPEVRIAVEDARRAELAAIRARHDALNASRMADERSMRARAGESRTLVTRLASGDEYQGDGYKNGMFLDLTGYANLVTLEPSEHEGDRYSGRFQKGQKTGVGVYTYGRNTNNKNSLRYEGEHSFGRKSGFGVFLWRSGDRYTGTFVDDIISGAGVHHFADGRRQEGYALNWFADGYGVEWAPDGTVIRSGIWSRNRLLRPLSAA